MSQGTPPLRGQRGFTLIEMLIVILILGGLTSICVLALTHLMSVGKADSANVELHQAHAAITSCMLEAEKGSLDGGVPVSWNGDEGVVTATSSAGVTYDAADYLRSNDFKACYLVSASGDITGVATQEWGDIYWVDGHWQ